MKNNKAQSPPGSAQAIQKVLQAERDAEHAIQECENEARQIVRDAHKTAQRIHANADQRITNTEMRHGHKLDQAIKTIASDGAVELRLDASQQYDAKRLQSVVETMARELCQADSATEDEPEAG